MTVNIQMYFLKFQAKEFVLSCGKWEIIESV